MLAYSWAKASNIKPTYSRQRQKDYDTARFSLNKKLSQINKLTFNLTELEKDPTKPRKEKKKC